MTKLKALDGRRCAAINCVMAAGTAPAEPAAIDGAGQHGEAPGKGNAIEHKHDRVHQLSGSAIRCQARDRQRRNSINPKKKM